MRHLCLYCDKSVTSWAKKLLSGLERWLLLKYSFKRMTYHKEVVELTDLLYTRFYANTLLHEIKTNWKNSSWLNLRLFRPRINWPHVIQHIAENNPSQSQWNDFCMFYVVSFEALHCFCSSCSSTDIETFRFLWI